MEKQKAKMKTPISYYGGKQQLATEILQLIPEHECYTESFFGGGAIFWAKEPAKLEVVNDNVAKVSSELAGDAYDNALAVTWGTLALVVFATVVLAWQLTKSLAGPIGEALIATAFGIATALPAVLAYNYFLRRLRLSLTEFENFADDFARLARKYDYKV